MPEVHATAVVFALNMRTEENKPTPCMHSSMTNRGAAREWRIRTARHMANILLWFTAALAAASVSACSDRDTARIKQTTHPTYDQQTGRL